MESTSIFSTAYFPPINYFIELIKSDNIFIESHEHYIRQTYRNRCQILSSNGVLNLSFPVKHKSGNKEKIHEIEIDNSTHWKKNHLIAIRSAYGKSPFFNFYADALLDPILNDNQNNLLTFNTNILNNIFKILKIKKSIKLTEDFKKNYPDIIRDYRYTIHPKKELLETKTEVYIQTFNDRFDFIPNLSILDLIFNLGPESKEFLLK